MRRYGGGNRRRETRVLQRRLPTVLVWLSWRHMWQNYARRQLRHLMHPTTGGGRTRLRRAVGEWRDQPDRPLQVHHVPHSRVGALLRRVHLRLAMVQLYTTRNRLQTIWLRQSTPFEGYHHHLLPRQALNKLSSLFYESAV